MKTPEGQRVKFVAHPELAPLDDEFKFARPDDDCPTGSSWRAELLTYNQDPGVNPLGLLPAWQLYTNPIYGKLVQQFGVEGVYILSAGWGLIPAGFLTPCYDITFSASADKYKRRRRTDLYSDLSLISADLEDESVFFVSKDYVGLACTLTQHLTLPKRIFYNSATPPEAPGFILERFKTKTRTNWHYECAKEFVANIGKIGVA